MSIKLTGGDSSRSSCSASGLQDRSGAGSSERPALRREVGIAKGGGAVLRFLMGLEGCRSTA